MNEKPPLLTLEEAQARGLWFISKRYGYGWVPITWQGWLVTTVYVLFLMALVTIEAARIPADKEIPDKDALVFFLIVIVWTVALVAVCMKKGEKAYWRWGK